MQQNSPFELTLKNAVIPAFIIVGLMWLIYIVDYILPINLYEWGVQAQTWKGLRGVFFMPLIHAPENIKHIFNNSLPTFLLLTALFYSYKEVAWKVFVSAWVLTGVFVWIFAISSSGYHIGMSGIIYALAGFLFTSGVIRKFLPLQAISMFVAFMYGGMIWGIFPMEEKISWEGHLMGLITGIILAFYYKKLGPTSPKYRYEIEKEMGIEPPDLEGMYYENLRIEKEKEEQLEREKQEIKIVYHFLRDDTIQTSQDSNTTGSLDDNDAE